MKKLSILILSVCLFPGLIYSQKYEFADSRGEEGLHVLINQPDAITLNFSIHSFSMNDLMIKGEMLKTIALPGHFLPGEAGAPSLPGNGHYVAIPEGAKPVLSVKYLAKETYQNINIAPSPVIPIDQQRGPLIYEKNEKIYSSDTFYPNETVKLSKVFQVRGVDAVMLGITPFAYNPVRKELVVYREIEIELSFEGGNGHYGEDRLRSRWWDPLLADLFLNYEQLPEVDYAAQRSRDIQTSGAEYLIICPDGQEFRNWADTIRQFRTEQGIVTKLVPVSEIGGNSAELIETYINNAYANWDVPPAACLMLGDFGSNGENSLLSNLRNDHPNGNNPYATDNPFADVDGDLMPDVIFSRITARNEAELSLMVKKIIDYERNPPVDPDFYHYPITALGWQTERWFQICSEAVGGYFRNVHGKEPVRINEVYGGEPETDPWSTAQNTEVILDLFGQNGLGYLPETPSELGEWRGGTADDINEAVNNGAFLLQHRDHGYYTGWGEPDYDTASISGLTNTNLPFVMSINCQTGKFNMAGECFAEKFLRHRTGGQASGALGMIAPTEISYSFVNDVFVWGVYDNMFPDFLPDHGTTPESRGMLPAFGHAAGKYFLEASGWPANGVAKDITFQIFHHHGDAFMQLYSEVPQYLAVDHDSTQLAGLETFGIQADEGAFIALSVEGELIGTATGTGSVMQVPIALQNPPSIIDVVVTKPNYFRYHERVQVIPPTGPFVIADSYIISDQDENNNGRLDIGETVLLDMILKNLGSESAGNVSATIHSTDEYLAVIDSTLEAGTIPPGGSAYVSGAFAVAAAGNTPNKHISKITMHASGGDTAWASTFRIQIHAPVLKYADFGVNDEGGNNNGRLDPGETADIAVSVTNKGDADAYDVYGLIASDDPYIRILADSAFFGDIAKDSTVTKTFSVKAIEITRPGHQADFSVAFSGKHGIEAGGEFHTFVGLFPVLVLDLDKNANSGNKIMSAIEDWGIFVEYQQEFPEDLSAYNSIFLCLGTSSQNHTLSNDEAMPLVDFLSQGGNLYIEGADTWYYDQLYNPTVLHPMFHISGVVDGYSDLATVNGVEGSFTEGLSYYFSGDNKYIDRLTPIAPAFTIFTNSSPEYANAVAYDAGSYKTIGASFEFGGLSNNANSTRKELMRRYLEFFGMVPITQIPETPSGEDTVCSSVSANTYATQEVQGALYYIWELNPPASGTVEGWEDTVAVQWTEGYTGDATLRVCGMNKSGLGPVSLSKLIKRFNPPGATGSLSNDSICQGDTTYINLLLSGVSPWELVISLGGYEVTMYPNKPNMAAIPLMPTEDLEVQIISLSDGTGCVTTGFPSALITVFPLPAAPVAPTGPENVYLLSSTESSYTTSGSGSSESYTWELLPEEAGSLGASEDGMTCTVQWESAFTGQATLKVRGINECGEGELSEAMTITVANAFGVEENESGVSINVFPNPNSGEFYVELQSDKFHRARLSLFNAMGEKAGESLEMEIDRKLILPYHLDDPAGGIYLLRVETDKGISTRKVLVR